MNLGMPAGIRCRRCVESGKPKSIICRRVLARAQMDRCRLQSLPDPGAGLETIGQHRAIIDALAAGNPDMARQAMVLHLSTSLRHTSRYLDRAKAG